MANHCLADFVNTKQQEQQQRVEGTYKDSRILGLGRDPCKETVNGCKVSQPTVTATSGENISVPELFC